MNKEKMTETNIKQYLRLQKYLIRLHQTGKVCVFAWMSGHVDDLTIEIASSRKDYHTKLYNSDVYLSYLSKREVDRIIKDIEQLLANLDAIKEQTLAEKEQQEREMYFRLQKKYGKE